MKHKVQFAVILTDKNKSVLCIDNRGIYRTLDDWKHRFCLTGSVIQAIGETDSLEINICHYCI